MPRPGRTAQHSTTPALPAGQPPRRPDLAPKAQPGTSSLNSPAGAGWVSIRSRARGLLALFLLTDVGPDDAPTRLMRGSHLYVPEFLAPYGEAGRG